MEIEYFLSRKFVRNVHVQNFGGYYRFNQNCSFSRRLDLKTAVLVEKQFKYSNRLIGHNCTRRFSVSDTVFVETILEELHVSESFRTSPLLLVEQQPIKKKQCNGAIGTETMFQR